MKINISRIKFFMSNFKNLNNIRCFLIKLLAKDDIMIVMNCKLKLVENHTLIYLNGSDNCVHNNIFVNLISNKDNSKTAIIEHKKNYKG